MIGRAIGGDGKVPGGEERACHDEVAGAVGVDAVFGEGEGGIGFAGLGNGGLHGAMDIEHGPGVRFGFREKPIGEGIKDCVVAFERGWVGIESGWEGAGLDGERVEDGRSEVDDLGTGRADFLPEFDDAILIGGEAIVREREVDAVVHAVAGDDEVGFGLGEYAVEAFVEIRTGEFAAGVTFFGEARDGLAGEAEVEEFEFEIGVFGDEGGFDVCDVGATEGDAVAKENDAFGLGEFGLSEGDEGEKKKEETHGEGE